MEPASSFLHFIVASQVALGEVARMLVFDEILLKQNGFRRAEHLGSL